MSNPLPAVGGQDPESLEDVRQRAPVAYRVQERAVTPADYAEVTERYPEVQRAAATFRWTGSWHTVFLTVDRSAGARYRKSSRPTSEITSSATAWRGMISKSIARSSWR